MQIWNRDIWTSYHHNMDHISNHQTIWMVFFCNLVILVSPVFLQLQDNLGVPYFFSVFPKPKAWHWPRQRLNFPSRCPPKGQAFTARLLRKLPHRLGAQVAGCNLGVGVLGWDGGMDGLGLGEVFVPKKYGNKMVGELLKSQINLGCAFLRWDTERFIRKMSW